MSDSSKAVCYYHKNENSIITTMEMLKTSFAGLVLKNPLIVSSCGLTNNADNNARLAQAGAAAIVLKSVFEEQIVRESQHLAQTGAHTEEADYMQAYLQAGVLNEYITLIKQSKQRCDIPIIASINCNTPGNWEYFTRAIEEAGADALELNVMSISTDIEAPYGAFEQRHIDILKAARKETRLPLIIKLGNNLSCPVRLINELYANGAAAVVLFNRFYHPDIDIDKMEYTAGHIFSEPADLSNALRWTGIASATVKNANIAVSGGIQNGKDIVKAILAGATAVEVCSAIYRHGDEWITTALGEIENWMHQNNFGSIASFAGKLNAKDPAHADNLERTQFLKYFGSHL